MEPGNPNVRAAALAAGLTFYKATKACRRGHTGERYASTGACKACAADSDKKLKAKRKADPQACERDASKRKRRYDANPEKFRARSRAHRLKNPMSAEAMVADRERRRSEYRDNFERERETRRQWAAANSEKKKLDDLLWARANPEKIQAHNRKWKQRNKDAVRSMTRNRRAKIAAAPGIHKAADVAAMVKSQTGLCACGCGCHLSEGFEVDHIVPLSRGGSNWPANLQLLAPTCNRSKNDKTMEEWFAFRSAVAAATVEVSL